MYLVRILLMLAFYLAVAGYAGAAGPGTLEIRWGRSSYFAYWPRPDHLTNVVSLSATDWNYVLAHREDGTVSEWGYGSQPVPSDLTNVASVAGGHFYRIALLSNGTVRVWSAQPELNLSLSNITAIAAGSYWGLALNADGRVTAWGDNLPKQLRVPRIRLRRARAIACGEKHFLAINAKGRVIAWGNNAYRQTRVPAGLRDVQAIAAGKWCSLALRSNGTVVAWGDNRFGQRSVPANLTNVTAISAGERHCLALKSDGTVVGWGSIDDAGTPIVPPSLTRVVALAAGAAESFFITQAPVVELWQVPTEVYQGHLARFEVRTGSSSPVRYQWRHNGMEINGATNSVLSIEQVSLADAGQYSVMVQNDFAERLATFPVFTVLTPRLELSATSLTLSFGQAFNFSAYAYGAAPTSYQWYRNGQIISGASEYRIELFGAHTNAGVYYAVAMTSSGSITSNPARVTVLPVVSVEPLTIFEGDVTNLRQISLTTSAPLLEDTTIGYYLEGTFNVEQRWGQVTLPKGATNGSIPLEVLGNIFRQPDSTFQVQVSNPGGIYRNAAITVLNDDAVPLLTATKFSLLEGDGVRDTQVIQLELSGTATNEVTVQFQTQDRTALAGRHYVATNGIITFPVGSTAQSISVTILGDIYAGPQKSFEVAFSNPQNTIFTNESASVIQIWDEDILQVPEGFTASMVATGLFLPTVVVALADRIFVCEQVGRVLEFRNGVRRTVLQLDVTTEDFAEAGLLGLALDPGFEDNHFFYVYYTTSRYPLVQNHVSRFIYSTNASAVLESEFRLLDLNPLVHGQIHHGGGLKFGPDGKLYIGVGENGVRDNAQTLTNLLGKILRLNSDGTIPTDNPFYSVATGNNRAIWALGLRNPWRFDFHPGSGQMFINDVGEEAWEEINEGLGGANYGWPLAEGFSNHPALKNPFSVYGHSITNCSITGGAFVGDGNAAFPDFSTTYFYSDFCGSVIRRLNMLDGNVQDFITGLRLPLDLQMGPDGALYCVVRDHYTAGGAVLRFSAGAR